MMPSSVTLSEL